MTAASKDGMSDELTEHECKIRELGERVGKLNDRMRFNITLMIAIALGLLFLSYVNYCAISDNQDRAHAHPREN